MNLGVEMRALDWAEINARRARVLVRCDARRVRWSGGLARPCMGHCVPRPMQADDCKEDAKMVVAAFAAIVSIVAIAAAAAAAEEEEEEEEEEE